jgi:hypothetical protein
MSIAPLVNINNRISMTVSNLCIAIIDAGVQLG